jgi:hypothetical protein
MRKIADSCLKTRTKTSFQRVHENGTELHKENMITKQERKTMKTITLDEDNCVVNTIDTPVAVRSQVDQIIRCSIDADMSPEDTVVESSRRYKNDLKTSTHSHDQNIITKRSFGPYDQRKMDLQFVKKGFANESSGDTISGIADSSCLNFEPNTTTSLSNNRSEQAVSEPMDCGSASSTNSKAVVTNTGASSSGDDKSNNRSCNSNSAGEMIKYAHQSYEQKLNHDTQRVESGGNSTFCTGMSTTKNIRSHSDPHHDIEHITKSESNMLTRCKPPSSDSGSDSGYVGSHSSNDAFGTSSSSSDGSRRHKAGKRKCTSKLSEQQRTSVSSDLADYSTGSNDSSNNGSPFAPLSEDSESYSVQQRPKQIYEARVPSPIVFHNKFKTSSLSDQDMKMLNTKPLSNPNRFPENWTLIRGRPKRKMHPSEDRCKDIFENSCRELSKNFQSAVKRSKHWPKISNVQSFRSSLTSESVYGSDQASKTDSGCPKTPLYDLGVDAMAKVLSYLHPIDAYRFASMPLSKAFMTTYTQHQDLWKILCLSEPFYAKVEKANGQEDDDSICSYPICKSLELKHVIGRYRLLYSSFIKCVRYLDRIKEDAQAGKVPAAVYSGNNEEALSFEENASLKRFFAKARELKNKNESDSEGAHSGDDSFAEACDGKGQAQKGVLALKAKKVRITSDTQIYFMLCFLICYSYYSLQVSKPKYGFSRLTNSLLGPCHTNSIPGNVGLPWSCAIYSVVNWMVAFADVPGILLMCLRSLPDLLVHEQMRISAQGAGLTDIALRAMVLYPDMVELHTAAFHSLVLLARPLGGKEGMLFHSAMVNASGIFNVGSATGKSGIAIMLDSMKRFVDNADLQAMACWSMVNIALIHSQKVVLVRLGGISVAVNAMIHHPFNADVQFRALFALINLVVPAEKQHENPDDAEAIRTQIADMNEKSENDMLNDGIEQVANLVVVAMRNFCSSEAILNRACLVLHNLSLNENNHAILLLTPNCYQMIEWCIGNYSCDNVLQQSARGTLQRLQITLSRNESLRHKFSESIKSQNAKA